VYEFYTSDKYNNTGHEGYSMTKTLGALVAGWSVTHSQLDIDKDITDTYGVQSPKHYRVTSRQIMSQALAGKDGPGEAWAYDAVGTSWINRMTEVILAATGRKSSEIWVEELQMPLGLSKEFEWRNADSAWAYGSSGTCRDYARIGQLMLNKGKWKGLQKPIVSADFVRQLARPQTKYAPYTNYSNPCYGLLTWLHTNTQNFPGTCLVPIDSPIPKEDAFPEGSPWDIFFAAGMFGQIVMVVPDHNAVVISMGQSGDQNGLAHVMYEGVCKAFGDCYKRVRQTFALIGHCDIRPRRRRVLHILACHILVAAIAHVHAVAWAAIQPNSWASSTLAEAHRRYLESFWWAYASLTFGSDVPVISHGEQILGVVLAAERTTLATAFIWWLTKQASFIDGEKQDEMAITMKVLTYLRSHKIPIGLQMQVMKMMSDGAKADTRQSRFVALAEQALPNEVRSAVFSELWLARLLSLGMLRDLMEGHDYFAQELAAAVSAQVIPPHFILYKGDEASPAAYSIIHGALKALITPGQALEHDYTAGMWVGEKALVNHEFRRGETIFAKATTELMVVPAHEFRNLVTKFELKDRFENLVKNKLWKGMCGRCGAFGDHFPQDCPEMQRRSMGCLRMGRVESYAAEKRSDRNSNVISPDFLRFLKDHEMHHLGETFARAGIINLVDVTRASVEDLVADPEVNLSDEEAKILFDAGNKQKKKLLRSCTALLANAGGEANHLIFLSHYKAEAGTEAALMQKDLEHLIHEDAGSPGQGLSSPVFIDSEDLQDLSDLQGHVQRSHNLVLLLTPGVLTRPWVLVEIVTAINYGTRVVPVEVQRRGVSFTFPDEAWFESLRDGALIDEGARALLESKNIDMPQLERAIRQVFTRIALPFSPHKTANIRSAELADILKQCSVRGSHT